MDWPKSSKLFQPLLAVVVCSVRSSFALTLASPRFGDATLNDQRAGIEAAKKKGNDEEYHGVLKKAFSQPQWDALSRWAAKSHQEQNSELSKKLQDALLMVSPGGESSSPDDRKRFDDLMVESLKALSTFREGHGVKAAAAIKTTLEAMSTLMTTAVAKGHEQLEQLFAFGAKLQELYYTILYYTIP